MNKAVIYARYSSSSQNEQSIDTQIDICKQFAKDKKLVIIREYVDKGISGTSANRPAFRQMIADSYEGHFQYVIVYKLDRFARDEYDDIRFERLLNDNGVKRLSATEVIPEDYFSGALIKAVTRLNNENYSRLLSQRVTAGLSKNVEKGLMVGGSVTWGYKLVDKKYEIDEDTAFYVRMIFNLFNEGFTTKSICDALYEKGVTNSNDKKFQHQHISKILHNKRYIGVFKYKNQEYPGFLPSIVDDDTFNKAQNKLGKNATKKGRIRNNTDYYLSGKLYCGYCKSKMTGYSGTGRHGQKFHYYRCPNKSCEKENERKDILENLVVDIVVEQVLNSDKLDDWIRNSIKIYYKSFEDKDKEISMIKNNIFGVKKKIDNVVNALTNIGYSEPLHEQLSSLEKQKQSLETDLAIKESNIPRPISTVMMKKMFLHYKKNSKEPEAIKAIIDLLVHKVIKYNDRVQVIFNLSNEFMVEKGVSLTSPHLHQLAKSSYELTMSIGMFEIIDSLVEFFILQNYDKYMVIKHLML